VEINLKEGKFKVDPSASDGIIKMFLRSLFWLCLVALVLAFLQPKAAKKWLQNAINYADEAKEVWGPRLKTWGNWLVDHVKDWGQFLLDGSLRIVSISLAIATFLLFFYTAGLAYGGKFAVAMAAPIGIFVLVLSALVTFLPVKLFPGKQRLRNAIAILGMWPIAIAVLIATLDISKLGEGFTFILILVGMFYILRRGNINAARFAAWAVLWFGIIFHTISFGLPALQTGIAGGWAKEKATNISFWDATHDKAATIEQARLRVFRDRLYGVATDTITAAILPTLTDNSVAVSRLPISIFPNEKLEILTDEKAAAWGIVFADPLLVALGDTSERMRSAASRAMGYVDMELVTYMNPNERVAFQEAHNSIVFYVPWGMVRADPLLTAEAATLTTQQGDTPTRFTISGSVNGTMVSGSIPVTEVAGIMDSDEWLEVTVDTRDPIISIPLQLARGDELELEYVSGTVGHNRLAGGGFDPKYADHKGVYHYTHDIGPSGYAPDPAMASWKQAKIQLLNQGAPYMSLLWGTIPSASGLQVAFEPGADYSSFEVDGQSNKLHLAFNDAWCDKDETDPGKYLQRQCERRIGSIKIRIRIVKPEPASEQVGLANN
jgi:hypothetical protein